MNHIKWTWISIIIRFLFLAMPMANETDHTITALKPLSQADLDLQISRQ